LAKDFFVGDLSTTSDDPEFYSAATVIDVPYGADQGFVFPGLVGGMQIIKWEISEKFLHARMTYESIDGIDGHGSATANNGEVVASYSITKHFDIRRDYNPNTGEEYNVIEENTTDRAWYQREYFRVDWSNNHITSSRRWDPLSGDDYDVEPLAYYVNDPSHPDVPVFDVKDGYFDVTNKLFLKPKTINLGFGDVPACFYRGSFVVGATYPWGNCENSEVTIRYSYRRKFAAGEEGHTDYEAIDWDGSRMNAFGIFNQQRLGWDRNYGIVDEKWVRPGQRYNIWEQSHLEQTCAVKEHTGCHGARDGDFNCDGKIDAAGGEFANGTADECEVTEQWGSRCDRLAQKCTIPYARRTPKAVPWYFTTNAEDKVIFESTEFATWQWDAAIRMGVQAGRYAECVATYTASLIGSEWAGSFNPEADINITHETCGALFPIDTSYDDAELDAVRDVNMCVKLGKTRADCIKASGRGENSVAAMDPLVVLCHSPVLETDNSACGEVGLVARPGDIRYHQVNLWPTRQSVSPWGYGPSLADPLTGEIISAGINVYNAVTDSAAQGFLDQIRWVNGELQASDLTSGKHVHDWVKAGDAGAMRSGRLMSQEEADQRAAGVVGASVEGMRDPSLMGTVEQHEMLDMVRKLEAEIVPPGVIPEDRSIFDERINRAKKSGVEAKLMNNMWLQMAAVDPDLSSEVKLEMASPLRRMNSQQMTRAYDQVQKKLAARGQCVMSAPEPTGIPSLAKVMAEKFPVLDALATAPEKAARLEKMWNYLRYKLNFNVILHEMGHTVGLRHNFVSSYDKYNYKTQYWQLRTDSGRVKTMCDGPQQDGADCVGPRYFDPLTDNEIDNSIWTWQQTSVMDYAGDITQDMLGLGVYDMAAARMFYGGTVDVRADISANAADQETKDIATVVRGMVDYPGYLFGQLISCPQGAGKCSRNPQSTNFDNYSMYNEAFKLVQPDRCTEADGAPPSWWAEYWKRMAADGVDNYFGEWSTLFDGQIVNGERCARPPIDFVAWDDMQADQITVDFDDPDYFTPRRASERCWVRENPEDSASACLVGQRPRVPYGFLTDNYADGWSPSAYRHDNGADMYEELVFHTNMYENRHIFDNFRRGRVNFTVYGAYQRALSRYHAKVGNLTQGFAYSVDFILREFARTRGLKFADTVNFNVNLILYDHAVAASVGFDHFVRTMLRPEVGQHYCQGTTFCNFNGDRVLRPLEDVIGGVPAGHVESLSLPNGNWVAGDSVNYGGRPLSNGFQYNHGHWTFDYLNQAGSYYEKTYAIEQMLSASYGGINFYRYDGLDARFRHVNFADLWPEQMRRLIGLSLTNDARMLGARISSQQNGLPATVEVTDSQGQPTGETLPAEPLAWLSFVPNDGPVACRPVEGVLSCTDGLGVPITNDAPTESTAWFLDPQLGYEVQKFIVFWYYVYQPREEINDWVDLLRIYRVGSDNDPDYLPENVVQWRDPESGLRYIARGYGEETIFEKTWDRGIAAKMIQWANELTAQAYELDDNVPFDPATGQANVKRDGDGFAILKDGLSCDDSVPCDQLRKYRGLLDFTRDTASNLGFPEPGLQIIQPPD